MRQNRVKKDFRYPELIAFDENPPSSQRLYKRPLF